MKFFKMDTRPLEPLFLCFNILSVFNNGRELDLSQPLLEREEDKEEERWPPVHKTEALSSAQHSAFSPAFLQGSAELKLPRAFPLIGIVALSICQMSNNMAHYGC